MNPIRNRNTTFTDLGLIDFKEGLDYQTGLFEKTIARKAENRLQPDAMRPTENFLIFCEHPHVYTLGKSGKEHNLLLGVEALDAIQASFYHTNRGGDITYHGPGQIVGYPVIDLENFFTDIHRYMRLLEEAVIQTLRAFDVIAGRIPGLTGVWVDPEGRHPRKICAMGVKMSRWVTMHGLALNVNPDLNYFSHIVPCGIQDKTVTSLQNEVGHPADIKTVSEILRNNIAELFEMNLIV